MSREGVPIGRIAGVEVRVSLAWVLLLALVVLIAAQLIAAAAPELSDVVEWVGGGVAAVAFLASVLAHELAHVLVARRRGVHSSVVVLGFLGGLAPYDLEGPTPRDELAIAAAGPAVSLTLAVLFVPLGLVLASFGGFAGVAGSVALVVGFLAGAHGLLSLVPGMPLDGGRMVRAIAWERSGDPRRGSRLAAVLGRVTGYALIAVGAAIALLSAPAFGLMVLSLGWFTTTGARAVERRLALERLLDGVSVREAMDREVPHVPPQLTLDTFADRYLPSGPGDAQAPTSLPVVADDRVLGVVGFDRIRRISRRAWATTRAEDVMAVPPDAPHLAPDDPLWDALEALRRSGLDGLAVVEGGGLRGMLTRRGATTAIRDRLRARAGRAGGGA